MRRCILLFTAAAVVACDQDTIEPEDRVVATGTYVYEGRWLHPATLEWDTIRGQLLLEVVTPDSVHGRWTIPGFVQDSIGGYWNENAYVMEAISTDGGITVTNRLARIGSPAQLNCSLTYREVRTDLEPLTTGGTCDADQEP